MQAPLPPERLDDVDTAFVGVTLLTMQVADDAAPARPDHTVIVRGGRIVDMGPRDSITLAEGTRVIDGAGRWLMPGLTDAHVHVWSGDELLLYLANGVTTVRNMWGTPIQLSLRASIAAGQLVGPQILTSGPILDGPNPIWNNSVVVDSPEQARATVVAQKAMGYDFLKVYDRMPAAAYAALVDAAREHELPVCGHVPHAVGLDGAVRAGQLSVEHLTGFDAYRTPEGLADTAALDTLADDMLAGNVWSCPTLVVFTKFVPAATSSAWFERPEMAFVSPTTKASWDPSTDFRLRDMTDADFARVAAGHANSRALVAALHERGVGLLLGTDAPNPFVVPGFAIHEELALLVEAGLTPYEALVAGTRNPALAHDRADSFGTIAPGLRADLLLLDADPLQDVAALQQRAGVMADGRWYPESDLRARLDELAALYSAPLDFLAYFAPLPDLGGFSARFEVRFNDAPLAMERVASNADATHNRVQVGYDPGSGFAFEIGQQRESGADQRVEVRGYLAAGTGSAIFERAGGALHARGDGIYAALNVQRALPETTYLSFPSFGTESRLHERLRSLAVGDELEVEVLSIAITQLIELSDTHLKIERLEDRELDTGIGTRPAQAFALDSHAVNGSGSVHSTLWLDAETGRPLGLEQVEQTGTIRALRQK